MKRMIWSACAGLILMSAAVALAQDSGGAPGGAPGDAPRRERIEKRVVMRDGASMGMRDGRGGPGGMRMGPGRDGPGPGGGMRGMRGRPGMWGPMLARELQLTDAQREKARDILDRRQRDAIQSRADLQIAQLDMHKLMRAERPEEGAIDSQIDRIARLRTQMAKARVSGMLEIRSLLTPDQQQKLHELRMNGPGGMPGMRGPGMRGRGGPGGMRPGSNEGDDDGDDDDGGDGDTVQ